MYDETRKLLTMLSENDTDGAKSFFANSDGQLVAYVIAEAARNAGQFGLSAADVADLIFDLY